MILSSSFNIFQDLDLVKLQILFFLQNHHLITFNAYGNNFIEIHSLYIYYSWFEYTKYLLCREKEINTVISYSKLHHEQNIK